ncbi:lipoyl(octanoyl) transferase LipB [Catenovulum sediminis]|uniref:lipoyl(octanoyl) transferase LipB n=1 Tax=Catenovulum sediminis TaxID=1740262 RepID=UPI00117C7B4F|nr:lipoyl(octanoyl) transferase LipB [Catenovulum sediminis]
MDKLIIRQLGLRDYLPIWQKMQDYTQTRTPQDLDEIWWVEHNPVFTQGQAGKAEHLLMPGEIPVVKADRGGQVTYHGPGQLVGYTLIDIRRKNMGVRQLVSILENSIANILKQFKIDAYPKKDAPGVYVNEEKIASLGLRIRRGCSFHGLALNINMDLAPFQRINPCGYQGLKMTQSSLLGGPQTVTQASQLLGRELIAQLGYQQIEEKIGFDNE